MKTQAICSLSMESRSLCTMIRFCGVRRLHCDLGMRDATTANRGCSSARDDQRAA